MKKLEWIVLFAMVISILVNDEVSILNQGEVEILEEDRTPWISLAELNIFDKENGDMRLGPGRAGEYTFFVRNTRNKDVIFTLKLMENSELPIGYSVQSENGEWLLGKEREKVSLSAENTEIQEKVNANSETRLTLHWEWSFERGEDVRDTQIGNMAALYKVSFHFQAEEWGTDRVVSKDIILHRGDGRPKTGDVSGDISSIIFAMVIAIFVIIILRKKRECKEEDIGDIVNVTEDAEDAMSVTEDIANATEDVMSVTEDTMKDVTEDIVNATKDVMSVTEDTMKDVTEDIAKL